MKRHNFDGELLTVREICERVPALSERTIRRHLAAGRDTTQAMLSYDPRQVYRAAGQKSVRVSRRKGGV